MIKIIAGASKGKKIKVPNKDVRPTSSLKREAIFSIIESYALKNKIDVYKEKCFVDLFAGSGSVGLEAISRGISHSYFYEINKEVSSILEENCKNICDIKKYTIIKKSGFKLTQYDLNFPISIIFIDPPYIFNQLNELLDILILNKNINKDTLIVIETQKNTQIEINNKLFFLKEKIYGKTKITFLRKL